MIYDNSHNGPILQLPAILNRSNPLLTENESQLNFTSEFSEKCKISQNHDSNSNISLFLGNKEIKDINDKDITENEKNNLYFVKNLKKIQKEKSVKFIIKKKKRGREKKKNLKKIHDKNTIDNVLRKIQVNYMSFLISFINEILNNLKYKEKFCKLDYKIKQNVNNKFFESLKTKNIGEIICSNISGKYKKDGKNNKDILEKIKEKKNNKEINNKENEVIINILSENYFDFFRKIYYKSSKLINLEEYGLDKQITLSDKVKMYKDFLNKNKELDKSEDYNNNINNCVKNKYIK